MRFAGIADRAFRFENLWTLVRGIYPSLTPNTMLQRYFNQYLNHSFSRISDLAALRCLFLVIVVFFGGPLFLVSRLASSTGSALRTRQRCMY